MWTPEIVEDQVATRRVCASELADQKNAGQSSSASGSDRQRECKFVQYNPAPPRWVRGMSGSEGRSCKQAEPLRHPKPVITGHRFPHVLHGAIWRLRHNARVRPAARGENFGLAFLLEEDGQLTSSSGGQSLEFGRLCSQVTDTAGAGLGVFRAPRWQLVQGLTRRACDDGWLQLSESHR